MKGTGSVLKMQRATLLELMMIVNRQLLSSFSFDVFDVNSEFLQPVYSL